MIEFIHRHWIFISFVIRLFHCLTYINTSERKRRFVYNMVRPPLFLDDSLSGDKSNTTFSSLSTASGEFTINQSPPTPTNQSTSRNPYVEQYLNIYYKKSLDQSVNKLSLLLGNE